MTEANPIAALFNQLRWSKPIRVKIWLGDVRPRNEISAQNAQLLQYLRVACRRTKFHPLQALVRIDGNSRYAIATSMCVECPRNITSRAFVEAIHSSLKRFSWWPPHKSRHAKFDIEILTERRLQKCLAEFSSLSLDFANCRLTSRHTSQQRRPRKGAGYKVHLHGEQLRRRKCVSSEGTNDQ
jgi:hypothetical protein